jgi:hypothetical protein
MQNKEYYVAGDELLSCYRQDRNECRESDDCTHGIAPRYGNGNCTLLSITGNVLLAFMS